MTMRIRGIWMNGMRKNSALGEGQETEDHRMEEWDQHWFGGDFLNMECGEVIIHISFSEDARKAFGTCEDPVNVLIRSEGSWWTYGGRDFYSDIVTVTFDKTNGHQLRKKLPYGKYFVEKEGYLGKKSSDYESSDYTSALPYVYFEISKETPEVPVFLEFKKDEEQDEISVVAGDSYAHSFYNKLYDEAKEKEINPYGRVQFHAAPENLEKEYFVVMELAKKSSKRIEDIHYFGKANDYTYTAELYPGIYRIHRVYYIDLEGNVLGEDEVIRGYEFEVLPQSDVIEVDVKIRENPTPAETELSKKDSLETVERESAVTLAKIETSEAGIVLNREDNPQNKVRVIIYYLITFSVLAGLIGAGRYFWKTKN